MHLRSKILTTAAFGTAAALSFAAAAGIALLVEDQSQTAVKLALEAGGQGWAQAETDGLQVILTGTAPDEAARFRALSLAGGAVDKDRVIDATDVQSTEALAPPEFSLEILRNGEGIQLIGLLPDGTKRKAIIEKMTEIAPGSPVTDMLEVADYPVPAGWAAALDFALVTLETLPRSKISVQAGKVDVVAITDSREEKARVETSLARRRPADLKLSFDISAPRPVITPFTLRFLIDTEGAHFDACSADTERARDRILAAARAAGAEGAQGCTIGMGVPSPDWATAVGMALAGLKELGAGSVTFSDADIVLVAEASVAPADFDRVVGELESNLPEVFSLKVELARPETAQAVVIEFLAERAEAGKLTLRGRVSDDTQRAVIENYARARFGHETVYGATRTAEGLPSGWSVRAMAGLEALAELDSGKLRVTPDLLHLEGVSGNAAASDKIARILARHLGESATIDLAIRYDKRLDPVLALPDGPECVARLNGALAKAKITFEPGSSTIASEGEGALEALAAAMKDCTEFRIELAGHTDSQGRDETNLALSQERAQAVLRALMDRRISVRNLVARGYGETQPIADNDTEDGREANRRIEFVLLDSTPMAEGEATPAEVPTPVADTAGAEPADAPHVPPSDEELNAEFTETSEAPMEHDGPDNTEAGPTPEASQDVTEAEAEPAAPAGVAPAAEPAIAAGTEAAAEAPAPEAGTADQPPALPPAPPEAVQAASAGAEAPAAEAAPVEPAATEPAPAEPEIVIEVQTPDKTTLRPLPRPQGLGTAQ